MEVHEWGVICMHWSACLRERNAQLPVRLLVSPSHCYSRIFMFAIRTIPTIFTPVVRAQSPATQWASGVRIPVIYACVSKSFRTESITKYTLTFGITRWEAIQRVMAAKLTKLTHKIAIQLHLVAESCTICSSRSRRPVRKLLDIPEHPTKWAAIILPAQ
jgi:hypothetical protein